MASKKPDVNPLEVINFRKVIAIEDEHLLKRRRRLFGEQEDIAGLKRTKFGIALSGGGIRSATINLGILKTLNKFGMLKRADYLSTVSGGGYTGAYIQATLKNEGKYEELFKDEHLKYMRSRGEYLVPGSGWLKRWNTLILTVGYLISLLMSWISPAIVVALIYIVYTIIGKLSNLESGLMTFRTSFESAGILTFATYILSGVIVMHLVANLILKYNVGVSRRFNQLESIIVGVGLLWLVVFWVSGFKFSEIVGAVSYVEYIIVAVLLVVAGFFTNPNALSFHRFYRNQLADAFLHFTGKHKNVPLHKMFQTDSKQDRDYLAPYPLINTCLNLQSTNDERFKGSKASDYFLLSPFYCGAKLTGYVATDRAPDYKQMTLPAATTISAAAVNPGMGMYSSKMLSIIMTLFNARLGFWVANPIKMSLGSIVWWPFYFFYELLSLIGTNNRKLNISDGGHIENLGVYELLRRKCRLIIAVDAGADPQFSFADLENLTIRARNELGLDIAFREEHIPEEVIRPKPSHGYSEQRYAIADVYYIWEEIKPVDANGQPVLDSQNQKVEVLVNYNKVRRLLDKLDRKEREELAKIIEQLNLRDHVGDLIMSLGQGGRSEVLAMIGNLTDNNKLQVVFRILLSLLRNVKKMLEDKLEDRITDTEKFESVFRQVIAIMEKRVSEQLRLGTLVYVKSSVTAPEGKPQLGDRSSLAYHTYKYKIYHPSFPHEPTSDQFFDMVQWESYYQLGQFIGAEVLGDERLEAFKQGPKPVFSVEELLNHFDRGDSLFPQAKALPKAPPRQVLATIATRKVDLQPEAVGMEPLAEAPPAAAEPETERSAPAEPSPVPPQPVAPVEEKLILGDEVQYKM